MKTDSFGTELKCSCCGSRRIRNLVAYSYNTLTEESEYRCMRCALPQVAVPDDLPWNGRKSRYRDSDQRQDAVIYLRVLRHLCSLSSRMITPEGLPICEARSWDDIAQDVLRSGYTGISDPTYRAILECPAGVGGRGDHPALCRITRRDSQ